MIFLSKFTLLIYLSKFTTGVKCSNLEYARRKVPLNLTFDIGIFESDIM